MLSKYQSTHRDYINNHRFCLFRSPTVLFSDPSKERDRCWRLISVCDTSHLAGFNRLWRTCTCCVPSSSIKNTMLTYHSRFWYYCFPHIWYMYHHFLIVHLRAGSHCSVRNIHLGSKMLQTDKNLTFNAEQIQNPLKRGVYYLSTKPLRN